MTDISVDVVTNTPISLDVVTNTPISVNSSTTNSPESFLTLTDTPDSYLGKANNIVKVNSTGTALEFSTSSSIISWGDLIGNILLQTDLQNQFGLKENLSNKSIDTSLGTSNTLYPSQNATKTYIDNRVLEIEDISGNIYVGVGKKIYLDKISDTYFIYNSTTLQLEVYVGGNLVQSFG